MKCALVRSPPCLCTQSPIFVGVVVENSIIVDSVKLMHLCFRSPNCICPIAFCHSFTLQRFLNHLHKFWDERTRTLNLRSQSRFIWGDTVLDNAVSDTSWSVWNRLSAWSQSSNFALIGLTMYISIAKLVRASSFYIQT